MTDAPRSCRATTKAGAPCKNVAQAGGDFCHIHAHMTQSTPKPAAARLADDPEFAQLVSELNQLADEMRGQTRSPEPPPFSHERLLGLVRTNFERVAALFGLEAATQLLDSLQGASPKDALDPDTWKGLYYILNALVSAQTESARTSILKQLNTIPGFALLSDIGAGLQGATAKDLVDPDTWKGLFYILDATARAQAGDLKRRLMGEDE